MRSTLGAQGNKKTTKNVYLPANNLSADLCVLEARTAHKTQLFPIVNISSGT